VAKLRESVPYVKLYRYITKQLYTKLNFMEIITIEMCGILWCRRTVRGRDVILVHCACAQRDMVIQ
jgi:hypothetical protein